MRVVFDKKKLARVVKVRLFAGVSVSVSVSVSVNVRVVSAVSVVCAYS